MRYQNNFRAPTFSVMLRNEDFTTRLVTLRQGTGTLPDEDYEKIRTNKMVIAAVRDGNLSFPDDEQMVAIFNADRFEYEARVRELHGEEDPADAVGKSEDVSALTKLVGEQAGENADLRERMARLEAILAAQTAPAPPAPAVPVEAPVAETPPAPPVAKPAKAAPAPVVPPVAPASDLPPPPPLAGS